MTAPRDARIFQDIRRTAVTAATGRRLLASYGWGRSMTGPMLSRLVVCGQRRFPIRPEAMCRSTTSIWTTA